MSTVWVAEMPESDLRDKAIKGLMWSAVESWGVQATQLFTFLILARLLSPETFGLVSTSNIFIHFVQSIVSSGFGDAIVQRKDLEKQHLDSAFWANVSFGLLLVGIGFWSASTIASTFGQPELEVIIRWLSLNVLLNSINNTQDAVLRRNLNFKGLAIRKLCGNLVSGVVGITLAILGFGVWSLVFQILAGNLCAVILTWRISEWRPSFQFSFSHLKELFSFGINIIGINILVFFGLRGDDLLIAYFLGPIALGYYTVAYKILLTFGTLLNEVIRKISLPVFSKLQSDRDKLREGFYTASKLLGLLSFPIYMAIFALSPELIVTLFGEKWGDSIPIMRVLSLVGLTRSITNFSGSIIVAVGKPSWNLWLLFGTTFVKLIAFFLATFYGIVAVAGALLISENVFLPLRFSMLQKLISVRVLDYLKIFLIPALLSLIMVVIIFYTRLILSDRLNPQYTLLICTTVGFITYSTGLRLVFPTASAKFLEAIKRRSFYSKK